MLERLEAEEMPPEKAPRQPDAHERRAVIDWIAELRDDEARRNAGDPGRVLARRLSNAEYDYTIRDLTGVDIRPTREFPVDPANEAGFDNSGESLAMSPALVKKYLAAARLVADHLVLKPDGFAFAPASGGHRHRPRQVLRPADHRFLPSGTRSTTPTTSWPPGGIEHRAALGKPRATLARLRRRGRAQPQVSGDDLGGPDGSPGRRPARSASCRRCGGSCRPTPRRRPTLRRDCERMRDFVVRLRKAHRAARAAKVQVSGASRRAASRSCSGGTASSPRKRMRYPAKASRRRARRASEFCRRLPRHVLRVRAAALLRPEERPVGAAADGRLPPDAGYFRDDAPLYELVLDEPGRRELDRALAGARFRHRGPDAPVPRLHLLRARRAAAVHAEARVRLRPRPKTRTRRPRPRSSGCARPTWPRPARTGPSDRAVKAIETYFATIVRRRSARSSRPGWPPSRAISRRSRRSPSAPTAGRCRRRSATTCSRSIAAARAGRAGPRGRDPRHGRQRADVAALLLPRRAGRGRARRSQPLSDYALASRLSYFLWSSMPDDELLAHAAAGDLHQPEVLVAQARRMLRDDRVRGLATEFAGNWLDFRRFEEHNGVDRERFPSFTNELRQAMFEEPIRFFVDLVQQRSLGARVPRRRSHVRQPDPGRSTTACPIPSVGPDEWVRVDDARRYGRGGLLPMAVFLTSELAGLADQPGEARATGSSAGCWARRSRRRRRTSPSCPRTRPSWAS